MQSLIEFDIGIKTFEAGARTRRQIFNFLKDPNKHKHFDWLGSYAAGRPIKPSAEYDRRQLKGVDTITRGLKLLFYIFEVDENLQFRRYKKAFSPDAERMLPHAEIRRISNGRHAGGAFSEKQIKTLLRALERVGFIERRREFNPTTEKTVLFVRLCPGIVLATLDSIQARMAADLKQPPLPPQAAKKATEKRSKTPRHSRVSPTAFKGRILHSNISDSSVDVSTIEMSSMKDNGTPSGVKCLSIEDIATPEETKLVKIIENNIFYDSPGLTLKQFKQMRRWSRTNSITQRMTYQRLIRYSEMRNDQYADGTWHFRCPLEIFLTAWPLIFKETKRLELLPKSAFADVFLNNLTTASEDFEAGLAVTANWDFPDTKVHDYTNAGDVQGIYKYVNRHRNGDIAGLSRLTQQFGFQFGLRQAMHNSPVEALEAIKICPDIATFCNLQPFHLAAFRQSIQRSHEDLIDTRETLLAWDIKN